MKKHSCTANILKKFINIVRFCPDCSAPIVPRKGVAYDYFDCYCCNLSITHANSRFLCIIFREARYSIRRVFFSGKYFKETPLSIIDISNICIDKRPN